MNSWQKELKKWRNYDFVKALKKQLPQAEIFLVGGAVRDNIINRETADYDLVIRNVGKKILEKFLSQNGRVDLVGKRFGVFKFSPKNWTNQPIDIALPRTEHSLTLSGQYRDFKINSNPKLTIEDDLSRRDFTINAMAWDVFNNKLIDPFAGLKDLKNKIIKTVGQPAQRFQEDYSRLLRAIRFAGQLNFSIETKTWQAIKTKIKNINLQLDGQRVVPYEVIAQELIKALAANSIKTLELLETSGAIKVLLPELLKMQGCPQPKNFHSEGDVWQHTILALQKITSREFKKEFGAKKIPNEVIWAVLFHDLGKPHTMTKTDRIRFNNHDNVSADLFVKIANRLRLSAGGLKIEPVEQLIRKHMLAAHADVNALKQTTVEKYFFTDLFPGQQLMMVIFADVLATIWDNGKPYTKDYRALKKRIAQLRTKAKNKVNLPKPIVNGHQIMKFFKLKPGAKIGELLTLAREQQLAGKIKTVSQALAYLKKYL